MLTLFIFIVFCLKKSYQLGIQRPAIRTIETSSGRRTITSLETIVKADIRTVYTQLCDFKTWNDWLSPGSNFVSTNELIEFSKVGDTVEEKFGLFQSSKIEWEVKEIKPRSCLKVCSRSAQATIGWDQLELEFILSSSHPSSTNLLWTYSWTVNNPFVCFIEEKFVRQSMIKDNAIALNKLSSLCSKNSILIN